MRYAIFTFCVALTTIGAPKVPGAPDLSSKEADDDVFTDSGDELIRQVQEGATGATGATGAAAPTTAEKSGEDKIDDIDLSALAIHEDHDKWKPIHGDSFYVKGVDYRYSFEITTASCRQQNSCKYPYILYVLFNPPVRWSNWNNPTVDYLIDITLKTGQNNAFKGVQNIKGVKGFKIVNLRPLRHQI